MTALMAAARNGLFEECEQLLTLGARAELKAPNHWTAGDIAEQMGHLELAEILGSFVGWVWI